MKQFAAVPPCDETPSALLVVRRPSSLERSFDNLKRLLPPNALFDFGIRCHSCCGTLYGSALRTTLNSSGASTRTTAFQPQRMWGRRKRKS